MLKTILLADFGNSFAKFTLLDLTKFKSISPQLLSPKKLSQELLISAIDDTVRKHQMTSFLDAFSQSMLWQEKYQNTEFSADKLYQDIMSAFDIKVINELAISSVRSQSFNQLFIEKSSQYLQSSHQQTLITQVNSPAEVSFPVVLKNNYEKVNKLGVDRWLAALACQYLLQSNTVIADAGTALTVDIVKDNSFAGGVIMPGADVMLASLTKTDNLPFVIDYCSQRLNYMATNTEQAIYSGVIMALTGAVSLAKHKLFDDTDDTKQEDNNSINVVVTGGNAALLNDALKYFDKSLECIIIKDLVAIGLLLSSKNVKNI